MKQMNLQELKLLANTLQEEFVGAQLQDILLGEGRLALQFWLGELFWFYVEMKGRAPLALILVQGIKQKMKETRPLLLFLRAHFKNKKLKAALVPEGKGRVLILDFSEQEERVLELRLFPGGQNIIARAAGKVVSYAKVKPLSVQVPEPVVSEIRSPDRLTQEWLANEAAPRERLGKESATPDIRTKKRNKLLVSIAKVESEIEEKEQHKWVEVGEWLKLHQHFQLPEEFQPFLDPKLNLSENIQRCFAKDKENKRKISGTRERLKQLQQELEHLDKGEFSGVPPKQKRSALEVAGARGRTHQLAENIQVYIGRSAEDNLALLRKAQSWDLWIHLKDFPGSHGIIRHPRGIEVSEGQLREAGLWVARETMARKSGLSAGVQYDLLVTECRYVRPIKGDRLGRVHYQNERVIRIRVS